jgi:hypothetical protein
MVFFLSSIIVIQIYSDNVLGKEPEPEDPNDPTFIAWNELYTKLDRISTITLSIAYISLGLAFGISGLMTNLRLKKYFNAFYTDHKCLLIVPPIGLSIPLIIRGIMDLLNLIHDIDVFTDKYRMYYDPIQFTIVDIIPLSF